MGYSLRPDFADPSYGYYGEVQTDSAATRIQKYSIFEDGIFRGPSQGESQSMSFSLSSVLEMKYRKKESFDPEFDEKEDKFVRTNLLDNLSMSTSYNFAADSFQLAPISIRARTSLFKNKLNITANTRLDPYVYGSDPVSVPYDLPNARRRNVFMFNETGELGRITSGQISLSTSFSSKNRKNQKTKDEDFDEDEFRHIQSTLYQYVDFDIPWDFRLNYNLSYSKPNLNKARITSTANVSGNFTFATNWKFQVQTGFNIIEKKANQTRISIFRNLHCWDMSFSWVPFGPRRSYNLSIAVKSATLSQLRLTKNNFWQDRFQ